MCRAALPWQNVSYVHPSWHDIMSCWAEGTFSGVCGVCTGKRYESKTQKSSAWLFISCRFDIRRNLVATIENLTWCFAPVKRWSCMLDRRHRRNITLLLIIVYRPVRLVSQPKFMRDVLPKNVRHVFHSVVQTCGLSCKQRMSNPTIQTNGLPF